MDDTPRVLITGATGRVGYSLATLLTYADLFGKAIVLVLHDIPDTEDKLDHLKMELQDCASPHLRGVEVALNEEEAFRLIDYAFLIGAKPRTEGMERVHLLKENVMTMKRQGLLIAKHAKPDVRVLVVANPCNTNAFIVAKYASTGRIPMENIAALSRLDHNRTVAQVVAKLGSSADSTDVKRVTVWGNHSSTMYPDVSRARITQKDKKNDTEIYFMVAQDWAHGDLVKAVRERGRELNHSSGLSAAMAAIDQMRDWVKGTEPDDWTSMAVVSSGMYNTKRGIFFSFPVVVDPETRKWEVVEHLILDPFVREKIRITNEELIKERDEAIAICESTP